METPHRLGKDAVQMKDGARARDVLDRLVQWAKNQPLVRAMVLESSRASDRTTTNAWEDTEFLAAVRAAGRRKLIVCALWTEICMAFPALDALREGYDVYPVVDAIGGTSEEAHRAALLKMQRA